MKRYLVKGVTNGNGREYEKRPFKTFVIAETKEQADKRLQRCKVLQFEILEEVQHKPRLYASLN